ncbi:cytochrome P450 [Gautieria morchelliformis]|nr:cytochrome P450 [Gautieria morchelliformis]
MYPCSSLRLPPGPPRKLIIGNVFDMPTQQMWVTFSQWARAYGDLVYLNILGQSMVIISSAHVAYELFEKRSTIYSDRFRFPVASKLMGLDWIVTFMPYGDKWRRHRRVIHQKFHPAAATEYQPVQLRHTRELLRRLYETPDLVTEHARHTTGAIIMEVVYGSMLPRQELYIATAEKTTSLLSAALTGLTGFPGLFLVDMIPILKYVPEWFPGAEFQKKARLVRKVASDMNEAPFEAVKQALNSGVAESSFTSSLLEEIKGDAPPEQEDIIRAAASTCFGGGTDTTLAALRIFFLAMLLFPEAQRKAQAELDGVVGSSRLPEYEDRKSLPYINALCKEILRWHPSFPIGAAHRVTQDDVFDGYFIPAGTIVIGNTWHILQDETKYGVDTDKFQPERFLDPDLKDPNIAFGYGRRICPGRYFAQSTIYITVASILSVFDITPSKDSSGRDLPAQATFEPGFMSPPMAFKCTISPRSNAAKSLILQEEKSL